MHSNNRTKKKSQFLQFDICEFYPSISEELLDKALVFAKIHTTVTPDEEDMIKSCRKSVLFNDGKVWTKKDRDFDVTMGAQDSAEIAELVGIFLLKQINSFLTSVGQKCHAGLYRDDGLIYIENSNGPLISKIEKALNHIFKSNKLKISIEQKGHTVNFLDVTLSTDGSFKPYRKPNSSIAYVSKTSNHPPSVLKNIPSSIQKRLSTISSSEAHFLGAKDEYQSALNIAGYSDALKYEPPQQSQRKRNRRRKIVWFNPPYSKNVATNIGKEFFNLLQVHFPRQHPFHSLFNRNTVKLSYSCTMNMNSIIKAHNMKVLKKNETNHTKPDKSCNCRDKLTCPVDNKCLTSNVVYKATVNYEDTEQSYIGMTECSFKTRYTQHKSSIKHSKHRNQTELANHIWSLKDKNVSYKLSWKIIDRAQSYKPGKVTCNLCLCEKYHILLGAKLINRKLELLNKCPHRRKYLTSNLRS